MQWIDANPWVLAILFSIGFYSLGWWIGGYVVRLIKWIRKCL